MSERLASAAAGSFEGAGRGLPAWTSFAALPRAHGDPLGLGRLRLRPEDFEVEERLGFAPDGEGEHLLLWVRKTGANTEWVARKIARLAGVTRSAVGYAGLKDRHALTYQWMSVPRPSREDLDWSALAGDGIEVLEVHRHRRKLRPGVLAGNRFRILIRDFVPDRAALESRLDRIRRQGTPSYFGEQRFGIDEGNLARAQELFDGRVKRVPHHQRGLWLSAARAQIFNETLAERVRRGDWCQPQTGDCLQLDGTHSFFPVESLEDTLIERAARMDLHPTGPLWGAGAPPTLGPIRVLEERVASRFPVWETGLAQFGLRQERRALRLPVADLVAEVGREGLQLRFELPAGTYATSLLRELIE